MSMPSHISEYMTAPSMPSNNSEYMTAPDELIDDDDNSATAPVTTAVATRSSLSPIQESSPTATLWHNLNRQMNNIEKSLKCPVCHATFRNPVVLPCVHAFCRECIERALKDKKQCPTCKQTATKRSLMEAPQYYEMAQAYKKVSRSFAITPIVNDPGLIGLTQLPPQDDDDDSEYDEEEDENVPIQNVAKGGPSLVDCHTHCQVSRTWHSVLKKNVPDSTEKGKWKMELQERERVLKTNEKALIKAAVRQQKRPSRDTTKRVNSGPRQALLDNENVVNNGQFLNGAAVEETSADKHEDSKVEPIMNHSGEDGVASIDADNAAKPQTDATNESFERNDDSALAATNQAASFKDDEGVKPKSTNSRQVPSLSQLAHEESMEASRDQEAANRSGEWLLEEEEEEEAKVTTPPTNEQVLSPDTVHRIKVFNVEANKLLESMQKDSPDQQPSFDNDGIVDEILHLDMAEESIRQDLNQPSHAIKQNALATRDKESLQEPTESQDNIEAEGEASHEFADHPEADSMPSEEVGDAIGALPHDDGMNDTMEVTEALETASARDMREDSRSVEAAECVATLAFVKATEADASNSEEVVSASGTMPNDDSRNDSVENTKADAQHSEEMVTGNGSMANDDSMDDNAETNTETGAARPSQQEVVTTNGVITNDYSYFMNATMETAQAPDHVESLESSTTSSEAFQVGNVVQVQSRTWPGVNKPGGVGRIAKVHTSPTLRYDVTYILGGKEKMVDAGFVSLHKTETRVGDSRKSRRIADNKENTIPPSLLAELSAAGFDVAGQQDQRPIIKREKMDRPLKPKVGATASRSNKKQPKRARKTKESTVPQSKRRRTNPTRTLKKPSCLPQLSADEAAELADARYEDLFRSKTMVNAVVSSLSERDQELIEVLAKESRKQKVALKLTKEFHPSTTTICVTAADQTVSRSRTLKAMRATLAGVPIVSPEWIASCLEKKKIVSPTSSTMIRSLPSKTPTLDSEGSKISFGVARTAARIYQREKGKMPIDAVVRPLERVSVFLCGKFQTPKKSHIQMLLRESGASIVTSPSMAVKTIKAGSESVVLMCDSSTTNEGSNLSQNLIKETEKALLQDPKNQNIRVVDFNWLFDSVSAAEMMEASLYEPSIPTARELWRLATSK